jgi:ribosomal protein L4
LEGRTKGAGESGGCRRTCTRRKGSTKERFALTRHAEQLAQHCAHAGALFNPRIYKSRAINDDLVYEHAAMVW